ncbi:NUDIX hydrolase [Paenibacillus spongiae]|uniref:NUDIX hydrolase n=1 Tax=Paenibacillus spongiae TaxID=2909671 RepID=A0ABY5S3J5_9BACL|nr:NUDIX hydrolase [Paenibacillus spongiae]UVI28043.1 NUDIX hydrolase [Paenibacillus spongiae]
MLTFITEVPTDRPVSGVHCVPVLSDGNLVLVWDKEEQVLTTIGGRLEENESLFDGLNREAMEEAGIELMEERMPFASWYWEEYDTYRIYFLTRVKRFIEMPKDFEKTGYVITNFELPLQ